MIPSPSRSTVVVSLVLLVASVGSVVGPGAATTDGYAVGDGLVVTLAADGSASLALRTTFDRSTDAEREAFETFRNDDAARDAAAARFGDRLRSVAAAAEATTGREMSVGDAVVAFDTVGTVGVVTVSARWTGLAAVEDGRLTVTEPFAEGFTTDRSFALVPPAGYRAVDATPPPDVRDDQRLTWTAGTDLDGFTVELEPADGHDRDGAASDSVGRTLEQAPGFGVGAALTAVSVVALVVCRRRGG